MRLWLIDTHDCGVRPLGDEGLKVESGDSVHWSGDSGKLYFILVRRGLQEIASIRVSDGNVHVLVSGQRHILKLALTPQVLVYAAASIKEPTELFACELDGTGERRLTDFNAWWRERASPNVSVRSFEVPDGDGGSEKIEGWLLLPPQASKGPFPLLLDVHGGPQSIAFLEFRKTLWRHVLCSRGWAVLALNSVGSSSYGLEFMRRIKDRWGELDLPQHLAAIKTLREDGIADDRLAIYGRSYQPPPRRRGHADFSYRLCLSSCRLGRTMGQSGRGRSSNRCAEADAEQFRHRHKWKQQRRTPPQKMNNPPAPTGSEERRLLCVSDRRATGATVAIAKPESCLLRK